MCAREARLLVRLRERVFRRARSARPVAAGRQEQNDDGDRRGTRGRDGHVAVGTGRWGGGRNVRGGRSRRRHV